MSFDDLGLSADLLQAVREAGYTTPTPIQEKAIPLVLQGRDVLGIAQTGTGKTASFTLPMIEILSRGRARARMPRTLILEPTRELAAQVAENFDKYGRNHKLTKALLIGGVSFADQETLLTQGVDVLIATPGRLLDHFERGKLLLSGVQIMVVDEADRMLDMGFIPDIERIFKLTPFTRQTLFFSATMPPEIQRITEQFLQNPVQIEVSKPATASATVTQRVVTIPSGDAVTRRAALRAVITGCTVKNAIIFCNRKTDVDIVAKSLIRHGFNAAPLHGDLDQRFRMQTLDRFKSGEVPILVASDVAARGLDITDVSHVFNYEPPRHAEDYVHRIGRTGRAGRAGAAFTLAAPEDGKSIAGIQKLLGYTIEAEAFAGVPEERLSQDERRSRSAPRSRPGRTGRPPPQRPEGIEEAGMTPILAVEAVAAPASSNPRKAASPPRSWPARQREAQPAPSRNRGDRAVVGFGDELPAFLARPFTSA